MKARFKLAAIVSNNLIEWNEAYLADKFQQVQDTLLKSDELDGSITLDGPVIPSFEIGDDMATLIDGFCFRAITTLLAGAETHVYRFSHCSSLCVFVAANTRVILLSDDDQEDMPTLYCERDALLRELYACGVRYIEFLNRLAGSTVSVADIERGPGHLREAAETARAAMISHGLLPGEV